VLLKTGVYCFRGLIGGQEGSGYTTGSVQIDKGDNGDYMEILLLSISMFFCVILNTQPSRQSFYKEF
jgi:hypothetical protein